MRSGEVPRFWAAVSVSNSQATIIDTLLDNTRYITQTPFLKTIKTHRDFVHLLHSRHHNPREFPLIIDIPSEQPQLHPSTPPGHQQWLPTDTSHSPTRAPTMRKTTSTSTNHHTQTSPYPDTAHHSRQPTVPHPKATLIRQATAPRAQTMASAHFLDSPVYQGRWARVRAV